MNILHELQQQIGVISKDSTNPFYNSKYFDINKLIDVLKPLLKEYKLTITQPFGIDNGKSYLHTVITDEKGEILADSKIYLPDNLDPQKMGSAITYYRRYSLQSMLLLQAEDDDANSTTKSRAVVKEKTSQQVGLSTEVCECGGAIDKYEGISKKNNKPFTKLTCLKCGNVTWG